MAIGGDVAASLLAQEIAHADINAAESVALPIAAVLTLLFFRSVVAALLPIPIGGFALASCAAIVRLGSNFTEIAIFALNVGGLPRTRSLDRLLAADGAALPRGAGSRPRARARP